MEVEAEDGGVLLLTADGVALAAAKEEIVSRKSDDKPFVPLTADELAKQLTAELPAGFKIHQTQNYLICYNTSPAYAQWVGGLFERLHKAFYNYWTRRGIETARAGVSAGGPGVRQPGVVRPVRPRARWATRPTRSSATTA